MTRYRIAVIPGDGIGRETVPEGIRVLDAVGARFGIEFAWDHFDWSCERYANTGAMMPDDGLDTISGHDAIFLGAVGFPGVPDHISLWGLLIPIRRQFQQYVNLRPVRLLNGVESPLKGRTADDIDFWVVRENNEGEYSEIGGRMFVGTDDEMVMQESVFTRRGTDRIMRYAFELARKRPAKHVTSATKSNGITYTMPFWDERFEAVAADYPDIETAKFHVDILAAQFVLHPDWSTSWWAATCSATSFPISARPWLARSASHPRRTSTRSATIRPCSSRSTVRHRISRAEASATRSGRSGRGR